MQKLAKSERLAKLKAQLLSDPFSTDEALARLYGVSVPTIRLDRQSLDIPQHKERIRKVAQSNAQKLTTLLKNELVGDLLEIIPGRGGMSILKTEANMVFQKTQIVRGHYIYAFAETLAIAVMDTQAALIDVANIKYRKPVSAGATLVARAEVKHIKQDSFIVWVIIKVLDDEVFRGKFTLSALKGF